MRKVPRRTPRPYEEGGGRGDRLCGTSARWLLMCRGGQTRESLPNLQPAGRWWRAGQCGETRHESRDGVLARHRGRWFGMDRRRTLGRSAAREVDHHLTHAQSAHEDAMRACRDALVAARVSHSAPRSLVVPGSRHLGKNYTARQGHCVGRVLQLRARRDRLPSRRRRTWHRRRCRRSPRRKRTPASGRYVPALIM